MTMTTLCRGTLLGPPPTGHVRRFIDSGVFVLPVGGPSRSLLEIRGALWVALPALICSFEAASSKFKFDGNFVRDLEHLQAIESLEKLCLCGHSSSSRCRLSLTWCFLAGSCV